MRTSARLMLGTRLITPGYHPSGGEYVIADVSSDDDGQTVVLTLERFGEEVRPVAHGKGKGWKKSGGKKGGY